MQRPPIWFIIIDVLTALPALRLPWLMSGYQGDNRIYLWLYPFIIILAAWLAYRCYALERTAMAWILIVISILTTVAIHML